MSYRQFSHLVPSSRRFLLSILVLIAACAEEAPPPEAVVARPVKLFTVDANLSDEVRQFPASIEAAKVMDSPTSRRRRKRPGRNWSSPPWYPRASSASKRRLRYQAGSTQNSASGEAVR